MFSGTLTTGGLEVAPDGAGGLALRQEGRTSKWVPQVQQLTFNGRYARERGQEVMYVTERAVFRLAAGGIELIEVAPGIDLAARRARADRLSRSGSPSRSRRWTPRLFRPEPMNLLPDFRARSRAAREVRPTRRGER